MHDVEPLSPEDATLLCATPPEAQLQIGALCCFEGGPLRDTDGGLRLDDLRDHVAACIHLIPRFRQRVRHVPFGLARPVWIDDVDFDLSHHVHDAVLPAPGGPAELRRFVADLLGRPLDPDHPLWDLWLIDGLDDGNVAVVLRAHHVVADGLSLLRAAIALLDFDADPSPDPPPDPWTAASEPCPAALAIGALAHRRRRQLELLVDAGRAVLDPRRPLSLATSILTGVTAPPTAPRTALTGRVGTRRDFLWASVSLESMHRLARSRGVTINDVVLAAVTGALRRHMGDEPGPSMDRAPKVLVPIGDAADGHGGNRFSFVVAGLPVHLEDPGAVLDHVHREMSTRKTSGQARRMLRLFSVVDLLPVPLLRATAPGVLARQPLVNLAVTDLPGSEASLYLLGSRLLAMHPIVSGVGNIACIVGVLSYGDRLGIGLTVDPDVVRDPDRFMADLIGASNELCGLAAP